MLLLIFLGCNDPISKETQGKGIVNQERNEGQILRDCFKSLNSYKPDTTIWRQIKLNFYENKEDKKIYYLSCSFSGEDLKEIEHKIDINTYQDFGEYGYDKDSVYYKYQTSDREWLFKLDTADRKSFKSLGNSMYAKDKNFVYYRGEIIKEADKETFEVINHPKRCVCAKDKNNFYLWDEVIKDSETIETLELEKYLKKK